MREIKGKYYYCKRLRQVDFLHKKGIDYINTIPDFNTKNRVVFVYENTPELIDGLSEYYFLRKANADTVNDVR